VPVAWFAAGQHRPIAHVQHGKQRSGAVPLVVMGDAFEVTQTHRQHRLATLQGLTLALFVHAQRQRVVPRARVKAHYVA